METRNNTLIRLYKSTDWKAICSIFSEAKPDEFRGIVSREHIIPLDQDEVILNSFRSSEIYVAEKENNIVGFTGYNKQLISFLFIDPNYYRQNIATRLLEHILPLVGNKAWLLVSKTNLPAINLYLKFGFTVAEEFKGKYNDSIEVTVLRLLRTTDFSP